MTVQHLPGIAWATFMVIVGFGLTVTGPKYLHLLDKGFQEKSRKNPEAAAKQVKINRIWGALFGLCGPGLIVFRLLAVP